MKSTPISALVKAAVLNLFPPASTSVVVRLLEERCSNNLPLIEKQGERGIERIRAAVLKLSEGDLAKLEQALKLANSDWRDVLVAAGFGNDLENHLHWLAKQKTE